MAKVYAKQYGYLFEKGIISPSSFFDTTQVYKCDLYPCTNYFSANDSIFKNLLRNGKGQYVFINSIKKAASSSNKLEVWLQYCVQNDTICIYEFTFDNDPSKQKKNIKLLKISFLYTPI